MSDIPPWLYHAYRRNLRRRKPTLTKGRDIHRIERAILIWPLHFYARWVQRKSKYEANTTVEDVK